MRENHQGDREITESTATQFVLAKDEAGKKYFCLRSDLKDPNHLTEKEKRHCIEDTAA